MWPLKRRHAPLPDKCNIVTQTVTELIMNGHHADAIRRITAELRMALNQFEHERETQAMKRLVKLTEELEALLCR